MAHKWKTWDPSLIWAHISCECICRAAIKHHPLYNNVECFAGKKGGYFEVCARTQVASSNVEKEPYSMALVWKAAKTPIRSSWSSFKWIFLGFFSPHGAKTRNLSTQKPVKMSAKASARIIMAGGWFMSWLTFKTLSFNLKSRMLKEYYNESDKLNWSSSYQPLNGHSHYASFFFIIISCGHSIWFLLRSILLCFPCNNDKMVYRCARLGHEMNTIQTTHAHKISH